MKGGMEKVKYEGRKLMEDYIRKKKWIEIRYDRNVEERLNTQGEMEK